MVGHGVYPPKQVTRKFGGIVFFLVNYRNCGKPTMAEVVPVAATHKTGKETQRVPDRHETFGQVTPQTLQCGGRNILVQPVEDFLRKVFKVTRCLHPAPDHRLHGLAQQGQSTIFFHRMACLISMTRQPFFTEKTTTFRQVGYPITDCPLVVRGTNAQSAQWFRPFTPPDNKF